MLKLKGSFLVIFIVLLHCNILAQNNSGDLFAGTSKVNISPVNRVFLAGFNYNPKQSLRITNTIQDSIYCRSVVIEFQGKSILLISCELVNLSGFYENYINTISNKFGFKPDEIFLSATHTHSAPLITLDTNFFCSGNIEYTKRLEEKILYSVQLAIDNKRRCNLYAGIGYSPVGVNRREMKLNNDLFPYDGGLIKEGRNPEGVTDKEVIVLKIQDQNDFPMACISNYACHSNSLSKRTNLISGDILGIASKYVESQVSDITALMLFGAGGNINPWFIVDSIYTNYDIKIAPNVLGTELGLEIFNAFNKAEIQEIKNKIKSDKKTLILPAKKEDEYLSDISLPKAKLDITIASFGEIAFIGLGCEPVVEIGLKVKDISPFKYNYIISICNGASGYFASKDMYKERGYEVSSSQYGPEAEGIVIKEIATILYNQYNE